MNFLFCECNALCQDAVTFSKDNIAMSETRTFIVWGVDNSCPLVSEATDIEASIAGISTVQKKGSSQEHINLLDLFTYVRPIKPSIGSKCTVIPLMLTVPTNIRMSVFG